MHWLVLLEYVNCNVWWQPLYYCGENFERAAMALTWSAASSFLHRRTHHLLLHLLHPGRRRPSLRQRFGGRTAVRLKVGVATVAVRHVTATIHLLLPRRLRTRALGVLGVFAARVFVACND